MNIRFVKEHDIDMLAELEAACFPIEEAASRDELYKRMQCFPDSFLVMEKDEMIIGMMNGCVSDHKTIYDEMYHDLSTHDEKGQYQTVFGLDIHPRYQHQGFGSQLMKAFQEMAQQAGRNGIVLTCKKEKIGFYEQFGFHQLGRSKSQHGGAVWYDMLCEF